MSFANLSLVYTLLCTIYNLCKGISGKEVIDHVFYVQKLNLTFQINRLTSQSIYDRISCNNTCMLSSLSVIKCFNKSTVFKSLRLSTAKHVPFGFLFDPL